MPLYLNLFLTFLKIGSVSFGGGYAMIPLVTDEVVAHGWMTAAEVLNFIAVAELNKSFNRESSFSSFHVSYIRRSNTYHFRNFLLSKV